MGNILVYGIPLLSLLTCGFVFWASAFYSKKISSSKKKSESHLIPFFFRFGRRIIYSLSLLWAFVLYYHVATSVPTASYALATMMRYFAFTALFLLYVVLTPGLVLSFFPRFKYNGIFIHLRRALGISVFFFAFLHGTIGFFNNLSGNISSVLFLSSRNQLALVMSGTAFCIFSLMAITSFDIAERILGKRWKMLHRLIYVAAILVIFHAFLIGSHFTNPTNLIPLVVNYISLTFILLEVGATVKRRLKQTPGMLTKASMSLWMVLVLIVVMGFAASYKGVTSRYDPHAAHKKGYSKDYSMSVSLEPKKPVAGQPVVLTFAVTDKRTGRILKRYQILQEKLMHVVILRHDLLSYDHIHPQYDDNGNFVISHTFPTEGTYSLFVEYSPPDFYENLSIATVTVGSPLKESKADLQVSSFTKQFGEVTVSLAFKNPIKVNDTVDFAYTLTDSKGQPISDLETYLAAFGHMSAVSEDLQTYTHVHPINGPLSAGDRGGPVVQFSTFFPKVGLYKIFTQFKRNGEVFVTDFVIEVK
jgi:DMSO/TMAO reductase YedYZ heme-binding membrane subunit